MKHTFLYILFVLQFSNFINAQTISDTLSTEQGDTLETIESDTSIIYVIQKSPIEIHEKIEIIKPWETKKYCISVWFGIDESFENRKSTSGFENYTAAVNNATKNILGYSVGMTLWRSKEKIYLASTLHFSRNNQEFTYSGYASKRRFNYANLGGSIGYWINKTNHLSFIPTLSLEANYLLSSGGFIYNTSNLAFANPLNDMVKYTKFLGSASLSVFFFLQAKSRILFLEPYIKVTPVHATAKNQPYVSNFYYVGIRFGFSTALFQKPTAPSPQVQ